jgi:hypothetical protein
MLEIIKIALAATAPAFDKMSAPAATFSPSKLNDKLKNDKAIESTATAAAKRVDTSIDEGE